MKQQGVKEDCLLQLLQGVSGTFRPGVLTCLMGVSGAGKTTLMDVLAGRKTGGIIEGSIAISGYPKNKKPLLAFLVTLNKMMSTLPMLLSMNLSYILLSFAS
ncbi:hypothetical protein SUGI_0333050 [Cryptomeria japonica]|nr:hypothetical protein SUGI_0333050 [Cryptomeria japonica]